jgi:acetyltransferase-like isoleucine patch superfamily enzyme
VIPRAVEPSRLRGILAARSLRGDVRVGRGAVIGRGVRISVARGSSLLIAGGSRVGDGCRLVGCGGRIELGVESVLGEQCTLIARREITIGEGSRLGDGVGILDFGPAPADSERPIRQQPLHAAAVVLGPGVVVGLRAAIGAGVRLGRGARVEPGVVLGGLAGPLLALAQAPPAPADASSASSAVAAAGEPAGGREAGG